MVRYEGHLSIGHVYKDVDESLITAVEELLIKAYEGQGLERIHEEWESFSLQGEISKKLDGTIG